MNKKENEKLLKYRGKKKDIENVIQREREKEREIEKQRERDRERDRLRERERGNVFRLQKKHLSVY